MRCHRPCVSSAPSTGAIRRAGDGVACARSPCAIRRAIGHWLADAFNLGPVPMPGDGTTPLQAASGPLAPFDNPGYVPNARAVMDLADPEASRWVLAGGQSGNPMSPHYGDLFALWVRGESVPIPWSRGECRRSNNFDARHRTARAASGIGSTLEGACGQPSEAHLTRLSPATLQFGESSAGVAG